MVAEKDYSVLPTQKAHRVHGPSSPAVAEGGTGNNQTIRSVVLTDDISLTWTTGQPGSTIPWHSHMPGLYQLLITTQGHCIWHYKDNEGQEKSIEAGPGDVVYLPGGAENKVEVVGDEPHTHIGVLPREPINRIEQLVGEADDVYDPNELVAGLSIDNTRDRIVHTDDNAFIE